MHICMATTFSHQFQVEPISFFKIITVHNLHQGKLMIPNKFVKKYGEGLPNTVFLKTPNGAEWKMKLEKRGSKIWFQEGLKEFAEYHSLAHGHLLVFRWENTSHFQVQIFDLSALEIDYTSKRTEGKTSSNYKGNKPPNEVNLENHRLGQRRKDNSSMEFLQRYRTRSGKSVIVESTMEALHHTDTKCKEKSKADANKVTALDRASSFKPCNPFFLVVMHPTYIRSGGVLNLPPMFFRNHFDFQKKQGLINLQLLNEGVWPAKLHIHKDKSHTKFRLSWKEFVKDNNLKVGDVCTFELIHRTKLTFLVHIFRDTDSSNCSMPQESGQMRAACKGPRKKMKTITASK